jgi:8-oxo-dGTP diphosphatase
LYSVDNTFIHVAAAAVVNDNGEVLVSQRKQGTHLEGYWEFPGGKIEQGETPESALARELKEELDIVPLSSRPLIRTRYHYPGKSVLLDVWRVKSFAGNPRGVEGQRIEWRALSQLDSNEFPPADLPVINALLLPSRYLITGQFTSISDFERRLVGVLNDGIRLVQLRLTHDWVEANGETYAQEVIRQCAVLCKQNAATMLLNVPGVIEPEIHHGIHLTSKQLSSISARPDCSIVAASCHSRQELEQAQSIGVDFAVLSPVKKTGSHPDAEPLGWDAFKQLVDNINIPVYALGGMAVDDIEQAWRSGGQGIAAIGALWNRLDRAHP